MRCSWTNYTLSRLNFAPRQGEIGVGGEQLGIGFSRAGMNGGVEGGLALGVNGAGGGKGGKSVGGGDLSTPALGISGGCGPRFVGCVVGFAGGGCSGGGDRGVSVG